MVNFFLLHIVYGGGQESMNLGVKSEDVAVLRKKYGSNEISKVKGNGFFRLLLRYYLLH